MLMKQGCKLSLLDKEKITSILLIEIILQLKAFDPKPLTQLEKYLTNMEKCLNIITPFKVTAPSLT